MKQGYLLYIGEGEEPVAIDEMLNLADLTEALGMTEEQLTAIVEKLLGEEQQEITDVWSMIEQAPAILAEIIAVLQGTQQNATKDVQPEELQKVIQLLKLAELLGSKTDTVYTQETQLSQLRDSLTSSLTQVQQTVVTVQQEAPKSDIPTNCHKNRDGCSTTSRNPTANNNTNKNSDDYIAC